MKPNFIHNSSENNSEPSTESAVELQHIHTETDLTNSPLAWAGGAVDGECSVNAP